MCPTGLKSFGKNLESARPFFGNACGKTKRSDKFPAQPISLTDQWTRRLNYNTSKAGETQASHLRPPFCLHIHLNACQKRVRQKDVMLRSSDIRQHLEMWVNKQLRMDMNLISGGWTHRGACPSRTVQKKKHFNVCNSVLFFPPCASNFDKIFPYLSASN